MNILKRLFILLVIAAVFCSSVSFTLVSADEPEAASEIIYVSLAGNDSNDGSAAKPFKTLARAQQAVLEKNDTMTGDIVVQIAAGTYYLENPINFTSEDSGTNGFRVIYRGEGEGRTVLSGGRLVGGWQQYDKTKNLWRAPATPLNGIRTRQMWVNGNRVWRASTENVPQLRDSDIVGSYETVGENVFATYRNPTEIELVGVGIWNWWPCSEYRMPIKRIEGKKLIMPEVNTLYGATQANCRTDRLDNVFEFLDEPGEWYLDNNEGYVYYMPKSGEDMATAEVIMPVLEKIIDISGTESQPVENLSFEGLTISHATWLGPNNPDYGYPNMQAGFSRDFGPGHRENVVVPGVLLEYCTNIIFERNVFERLGGAGIWMRTGVKNTNIVGNVFRDISQNGIMLSSIFQVNTQQTPPEQDCDNIRIENNYVHHVGIEYLGCVGIFSGFPKNSVIAHNEVAYVPYCGIFQGWGWMNFWKTWVDDDPSTHTHNENNKVLNNLVHHVLLTPNDGSAITTREVGDGGGIYTLGIQPGLEIAGNVVEHFGRTELATAIYLDDGTRFATVRDNVGYDGSLALYSKGADNIVYNNYFDESFDVTTIGNQKIGHTQYTSLPDPVGHENKLYDNVTVKNDYYPVYITANAGLEYEYQDIKVRGQENENAAYGKSVTLLNEEGYVIKAAGGTNASNLTDGNERTFTRAQTAGSWSAEIDLGSKRAIDTINILFNEQNVPEAFSVSLSENGKDFIEFTPDEAEGIQRKINTDGMIARIIRVTSVKGSMAVAEVQAITNDFIPAPKAEDVLAGRETVTFSDIAAHWAQADIEFLATLGIIKGESKEIFNPEKPVSKAEWSVLLARTMGIQKTPYRGMYNDVYGSDWYSDFVQALADKGAVSAIMTPNNMYLPNVPLSREEAAVFVISLSPNTENEEVVTFSDIGDALPDFQPYIIKAAQMGLMTGVTESTFAPADSLTRAEASVLLRRIWNYLNNIE